MWECEKERVSTISSVRLLCVCVFYTTPGRIKRGEKAEKIVIKTAAPRGDLHRVDGVHVVVVARGET